MKTALVVLVIPIAMLAAHALAAQRTFVASSGGDSNPCSLTQPCRSFAAAIALTDTNGEIIVLDSAGYGAVTVTKGVAIAAPPGIYAGISVFSGTNGVDINAAGQKVVLRGLTINGQAGNNGVNITNAAEVHIENCVVSNMNATGIQITSAGAVFVDHVVMRSNNTGLALTGSGVHLFVDDSRVAQSSFDGVMLLTGHTTLNRVSIENNGGFGINMTAGPSADPRLSARDIVVVDNALDGVTMSANTGATARAEFEHSTLSRNGQAGLSLIATSGAPVSAHASNINASNNVLDGVAANGVGAVLTVNGSTLTRNQAYGMEELNNATLRTLVDNTADGNVLGATFGTITTITHE